ncbi:MAG: HD-GYP domain-containing protein [Terriglobia bacterium]
MQETASRIESEGGLHGPEYVRRRKALEAKVFPLVIEAEQHHRYLTSHQAGVAWIAAAIAKEMGFEASRVDGVRLSSSVHDVGMVKVPTYAINKASSLTTQERKLLEHHCQVGADLLVSIESPWPLDLVALQHHERLDGSGYPRGLKADSIILEARIVAVADAIEAMSMRRSHREIPGIRKALEYVSKKKGSTYDTDVVRAAMAVFADRDK